MLAMRARYWRGLLRLTFIPHSARKESVEASKVPLPGNARRTSCSFVTAIAPYALYFLPVYLQLKLFPRLSADPSELPPAFAAHFHPRPLPEQSASSTLISNRLRHHAHSHPPPPTSPAHVRSEPLARHRVHHSG